MSFLTLAAMFMVLRRPSTNNVRVPLWPYMVDRGTANSADALHMELCDVCSKWQKRYLAPLGTYWPTAAR
jgi:hypothetical protein